MTLAQIFAAAYLAGTCLGIVAADALPWWASGTPAWAMLFFAAAVTAWCSPWDMRAGQSIGWGLFYGAMSGAAAADFAEVADLLVWPGHDETAAVSAAIGVAMCWAFVSVAGPRCDCRPFRPIYVGFWMYLVTVVIGYAPIVREVMS